MKLIIRAGPQYNFKLHLNCARRDIFNATWWAAPHLSTFYWRIRIWKTLQEVLPTFVFLSCPVQPVEITSGESSGTTTILMIILYRELLPGRNKRTLDYRRASKHASHRPHRVCNLSVLCKDEDSQSEFIRTIVNYGLEWHAGADQGRKRDGKEGTTAVLRWRRDRFRFLQLVLFRTRYTTV